jgi:uncharacterized membrane protein YbaN (DUF454 family)
VGAGFGFVGLGVVGAILPGLLSTVFFILALWAFKKSSPRFERWLLANRYIGPTLRDWDEHRSIRKGTRSFAIGLIWVTIAVSAVLVGSWWLRGVLALVAVGVTLYLMTVKLRPEPIR